MGVGAMGFSRTKLFQSKNETQIDRNNILGKGRDSVVFQGINKKNNVAIKRMVLPISTKEYKLLAKLSHENVVTLVDTYDDDNFRYIILELCPGSLLQVIKNTYNGPPLPPDYEVSFQIADGLDYIHSKNLIHFDINPENILISTKGTIKLADFGFSQKMKNGFCILSSNSNGGTYSWMAPEILPSENNSDVRVSAMADVFSCGCVLIVFLTRQNGGIHPFGNWEDEKHVQINIWNGHPVNSDKIIDLLPLAHIVLKMIAITPKDRMSLMEVKKNLSISIPASHMNQNTFQQTLVLPNPAVDEEPNPKNFYYDDDDKEQEENEQRDQTSPV